MGKVKKEKVSNDGDGADKLAEDLRRVSLTLRASDGVPWREAVVRDARVEYMRGKDLMRYLQGHPELFDSVLRDVASPAASRVVEDRAAAFVEILMQNGLLQRAQQEDSENRVKQGKKPSKWPKRLELLRAEEWELQSFYVWSFTRPTSPWTLALSILAVLGVVLSCLFPLAPLKLKWAVVYAGWGFLGVCVLVILVRLFAFAIVWTLTGRRIWLLPMLFADVSVRDSFVTLLGESEDDDGHPVPPTKWYLRLLVFSAAAVVLVLLRSVTPQRDSVLKSASNVNRSVLEWLNMIDPPREKLAEAAADKEL